jgi:hypothetical protein
MVYSPFLEGSNLISIKGILRKLYHYNHHAENWDLNTRPKPVQSGSTASSRLNNDPASGASDGGAQSKSMHNWGGPLVRHALQAIYTLAFICLLRSDEVLKIHRDHVEFVKDDDISEYMVLTLPFRKTHQDGRMFSHLFAVALSNADHLKWQMFNLFTSTHLTKRRLICARFVPWQSGLKQAKSLLAFCFEDLWPMIAHLLMRILLW